MKHLFFICVLFFGISVFSQTNSTEKVEYLTVRVQYGKTMAGYKYELYVDIGTSGSHSLSGNITNVDEKVIISDDKGKYVFDSDIDLLNYFANNGWRIIQSGEIDILDQHYYTYLMEKETK